MVLLLEPDLSGLVCLDDGFNRWLLSSYKVSVVNNCPVSGKQKGDLYQPPFPLYFLLAGPPVCIFLVLARCTWLTAHFMPRLIGLPGEKSRGCHRPRVPGVAPKPMVQVLRPFHSSL